MKLHCRVSDLTNRTTSDPAILSVPRRSRRGSGCLCALMLLASPALLCAQFHEPIPEELKMTVDLKAPGADAVFLDTAEVADDELHYQSFYARIKVLKEKGKELATVELPYLHGSFKIVDIKARTIHADGTVIPLTGKPEDLLAVKSKSRQGDDFQINKKVFNLPSVEVGSILEYYYQLSYDEGIYTSPTWEVQRPYFVHHERFSFKPFKGFLPGMLNATSRYLVGEHGDVLNTLIWWPILPTNTVVKADAGGIYHLELTDIPATPNEEHMPPIESLRYRVQFYYKSSSNAQNFWIEEGKRWSKEVDHFAEPSKTLKAGVAGLIAPGDSDIDKAKKLYKAVQALDNTDYSRKKSEAELKLLKIKAAKHAEDTWAQKSGDSEDIALLYLAMLRAAGLTAYAEKLVNRRRALFDASYLTMDQLDDTLVDLNTGGKHIELDPGEKMCPFQTVSWKHSSAGGLSQSAQGVSGFTSASQQYPANKTTRIGDITVDANGSMTGILRFVMTGQEALHWRQIALQNDLDEVKKRFDDSLNSLIPDGVEAHFDHFLGLDDPDVNLIAIVNAHGTLGAATSKRLMLPAFFFETRGSHPFVAQDKRQQPVDMHYGDLVTDDVTYVLPEGFSVEGTPQDAKISWPEHAILVNKAVSAPGKVTIVRSLARAFTFAKPEEYQDLRGFYQKIAAADQQQLVLTTAPAVPKGK